MDKNRKINDNAKKAPRFNVLDAFIVLLVLLAVVGIYFRYTIIDFITDNEQDKSYAVTFSVENIRYTTPDYINIGDDIYFTSSGALMGTLISESDNKTALNITPASKYFETYSGEDVSVPYPNEQSRVNIKGRMVCSGKFSADQGLRIDGVTYIAPNGEYAVQTELVSFIVKVISIEEYIES